MPRTSAWRSELKKERLVDENLQVSELVYKVLLLASYFRERFTR